MAAGQLETVRPALPPLPTVVVFTEEYTAEVLRAHGWHLVQGKRARQPPYNFFPRGKWRSKWWFVLTPSIGRWYPVGAGQKPHTALRSALRRTP